MTRRLDVNFEKLSAHTLLLLGLILRETFSFWTGHPSDFELWVRLGFAVVHATNPYQPIPPAVGLSFANVYTNINNPTIAYLPFWPLLTGLMYMIFMTIGVDNRFLYYLLLKQPIIIGDLTLGLLLSAYVKSRKPELSKWVLAFWMLCPLPIIISGIWGMFDSIAMSFVIAALLTNRRSTRAFWDGIAIFAKSIPIIFAVPITFRERSDWKWLALTVAIPLGGLGIFLLVEHLSASIVLRTLLSTASKGGESMSVWDILYYLTYYGVMNPLGPTTYATLGLVWIPALILFMIVSYRKFRLNTDFELIQLLLIMVLTFLIFKGRVTEQYSIYLLSLSVIDVAVWTPSRKKLLYSTTVVALLYLISNNYFLIRFLSPIYPAYLQVELQLSQQIGAYRLLTNLALGLAFTCLNLYYLFDILRYADKPKTINSARFKERKSKRFV